MSLHHSVVVMETEEEEEEGATRRRRGRGSSGFPLSRVLSDNVDEFTCKICADFAESPVVTLCANKHVFCKACLEEWFLSSNALSRVRVAKKKRRMEPTPDLKV